MNFQVLIAMESLSSTYSPPLDHRYRHQNESTQITVFWPSFDQMQARTQQMHLQGPPNLHMAAEVFPSPQASIEGTFVNPQLIAPADRALFCPVSSHWVFQVLMRRRQKAKNPLSTSLQGSAEHPSPHIGHALFCPVSHWVFRILTRHRQGTKNHLSHLSIDQACCHCFDYYPIDRRRRGMS